MCGKAHIMLFGGTLEGRELTQLLLEEGYVLSYSCVTDYGSQLLDQALFESLYPVHERLHKLQGIKKPEEIAAYIQAKNIALIVDATHPYASSISKSLARVCLELEVSLIRFERQLCCGDDFENPYIHQVNDHSEAVSYYRQHFYPTRIFLSTGAYHLQSYAQEDIRDKIQLRILPSEDSINCALTAGFFPEQLICAQPPFSYEENKEQFLKHKTGVLITKDGGQAAGIKEKIRAALELDMHIIVIKPPQASPELQEIRSALGSAYKSFHSYSDLLQQVSLCVQKI